MENIIANLTHQVSVELKKHHLKLVTVESCTGGGLSYFLTNIPGSSDWFERGLVTYSNEAKMELLNVKANTLEKYGAVSEETAREMVIGGLKASHANIAVSITGIAGPNGGTPDKPVGTVWIGWGDKKKINTTLYHFDGNREQVRLQSIISALNELLTFVKKNLP
ncbi:MAG: hypothetical protein ACD_46C00541G0002 [uncultured bacterium]|nr:MAG: hypothetical protein ACD_46C00541G0002 [uncultured bacterium]